MDGSSMDTSGSGSVNGNGDALRAPSGDGGVVRRTSGRGPLSCAECRRLKLKCDRVWPCGPCQRRGCSAICPDGSLIPGKSNRFILADTKQLHERIEELSNRIRELEDALKAAHASPTPHPLLRDELLRLKAPLQTSLEINDPSKWNGAGDDGGRDPPTSDMLGTLTVDESTGASSYHGATAASDVSLLAGLPFFRPDAGLGALIDLPQVDPEHAHTTLWDALPAMAVAMDLVDGFYLNAAWLYDPVPREQMYDILITMYGDSVEEPLPTYLQHRQHSRRASISSPTFLLQESPVSITEQEHAPNEGLGTHDFALFYTMLAISAFVSPSRTAFSPEAEEYQRLARIALAADGGVLDEIGLTGVQTLLLMCYYLQLSDRKNAPANNWAILGLAAKLSQAVNRDSGKWNLQAAETQKRRNLFWELFTMDQLQSLGFGRPPSYILSHIDCELPSDNHATIGHSGETEPGYHMWKFGYAREVLSSLIDQAFGAKAPQYNTIIMLDKVVRQYTVPPELLVNEADATAIGLTMQRHAIQVLKETSILYLHRSFFARAITDKPGDPLGHKFAPSVAAAVNSAMTVVDVVNNLFNSHMLTARFWFFWSHAFSAAMVLGSYVARIPGAQNASSALQKFDTACTMFTRPAPYLLLLPIMLKLQSKARLAFQEWHTSPPSRGRPQRLSVVTSPREEELPLIGVTTTRRPSPSPSRSRPLSRSPSGRNRNLSRNNSPLRSPHSSTGFDGMVSSPGAFPAGTTVYSETGILPSPGGLAPPSPTPFRRSSSPALLGGGYRASSPSLSGGLLPPNNGLRPSSPHLTPTALQPSSPGLTPIAATYWTAPPQFLGVDDPAAAVTPSSDPYSSLAGWNGRQRSHSRSHSEHVIAAAPMAAPVPGHHGHHGYSHSISEMPTLNHSMSVPTMDGGLMAHHNPHRAHSLPQVGLETQAGFPPAPPRIRTPQPEPPQHAHPVPSRGGASGMYGMDMHTMHHAAATTVVQPQPHIANPQPHTALGMNGGLGLNTGMLGSYDPTGLGVSPVSSSGPSGAPAGFVDDAYLAALMGGRYEMVGFAPGDGSLDGQWGKFVMGVYQS
ncbi:fungal-specific transcription factor domain-containing protein [Auriculariales sp. MPI-PUGE-AT-0066]|nr:fungal-specific transcription factor domain-containing protein [Auriculariales sp. MPI-PUGE-AT-0066]